VDPECLFRNRTAEIVALVLVAEAIELKQVLGRSLDAFSEKTVRSDSSLILTMVLINDAPPGFSRDS